VPYFFVIDTERALPTVPLMPVSSPPLGGRCTRLTSTPVRALAGTR
jgi:hypothetical protein